MHQSRCHSKCWKKWKKVLADKKRNFYVSTISIGLGRVFAVEVCVQVSADRALGVGLLVDAEG